MTQETSNIEAAAREIAQRLESTWNAGDGAGFASVFANDADFVNVRGEIHRGRESIALGHESIFATIYQGSTVRYDVLAARLLADGVILAQNSALLQVPRGPLAGEHRAVQSLVLAQTGDGWEVASFHNTLVAPPMPRRDG
jgi:uncharacterized protein (TIGR02246 family)